MKYPNKIIYLFLLMLLSACNLGLEVEPESSYTESSYYSSVENAQFAVQGAYSVLSTNGMYGFNFSGIFPRDTDISQYQSAFSATNQRQIIAKYDFNPTIAAFQSSWQQIYLGLQRANAVIEGIQQMELIINGTEEGKASLNRSLGEAFFLRGWLHFDLVRTFGEAPMITKAYNIGDDAFVGRTSTEALYNQIIEDMSKAATLVPWHTEVALDERPTKGAILGFLGRVNLYAAGYSLKPDGSVSRPTNFATYYQGALTALDGLIASGQHGLNTGGAFGFDEVFNNYHKFLLETNESMLEVPFYSSIGASSSNIGNILGVKQHPRSPYLKAVGHVLAIPSFYNSFDPTDPRRDFSIANFEIQKNGTPKPYRKAGKPNMELFTAGKWERRKIFLFGSPGNSTTNNNTNLNWTMLRYSDVLLMYAEAFHEVQKEGASTTLISGLNQYDALNLVRSRVGIEEINPGNVTTKASSSSFAYGDNPDDFSIVLRNERAWELAFEGWRKYDLNRWNSLDAAIANTRVQLDAINPAFKYFAAENFEVNKEELYPIPQRETLENVNLSNGIN